ncbi:MAG TPA: sigma-70 family RNA polymerase sigma factor [Polyangia bacterium]
MTSLGADARPAPDEDSVLIGRCLAGDQEAFRPLVQRHQRIAFSVAYRMLGSRADAEDAAQQGFVDAYAAIERFQSDGRPNAFGSWLLRIVVNRCKDVLKSKKRTESSLEPEMAVSEAAFSQQPRDPEAQLSESHERRALERALQSLAPKYREVLILKDVEELPYEEIREILRLPITTLKIRVVRARAMMREALESMTGMNGMNG